MWDYDSTQEVLLCTCISTVTQYLTEGEARMDVSRACGCYASVSPPELLYE
jgi:hypothetical protein